jgi:hypothetical protein
MHLGDGRISHVGFGVEPLYEGQSTYDAFAFAKM